MEGVGQGICLKQGMGHVQRVERAGHERRKRGFKPRGSGNMPRKAEDMSRERRERGMRGKREGLNPAGAEICPAK